MSARESLTSEIPASCRRDRLAIAVMLTYIAGAVIVSRLLAIPTNPVNSLYRIGASWLSLAPLTLVFLLIRTVQVVGRDPFRRFVQIGA